MKLTTLGSGSKGNCYIIGDSKESLILELGVPFKEVKRALEYDLSTVAGCLVTHEHKDHCKAVPDAIQAGLEVFTSRGTVDAIGIKSYRLLALLPMQTVAIGNFRVMPFEVSHDAAQPFGYLIKHPKIGALLFLTDTYFSPYTFKGLTNIMVECNYSLEIANRNVEAGMSLAHRNRVLRSHMELNTTLDLLRANDLSAVNNIVLLHLSDGNSNAEEFKAAVRGVAPGKSVEVADKGMVIDFGRHPF